ncbi:MAG: hypothetical protein II748_02190 [Clostridia bacterium]|nr:hypothetical protein [Clostridia bacterium]
MNKKSTKKALISSMIALAVCFAMLVGSTFAWFTDYVSSNGNIIKSGILNIDLEVLRGDDGYVSIKTNGDPVFDYDLWEPGYTEWANVRVITTGNLALKYTMRIVANGEVSALADVIDVYYKAEEVTMPATRDLSGLTKLGTLSEVLAGGANMTINDTLIPEEQNTEDKATIALHMQEEAGNEYQNLSLGTDFSIQILATQYTFEEDSWDDQYDADAAFPGDPVVTDITVTGVDVYSSPTDDTPAYTNITLDKAKRFTCPDTAATLESSQYNKTYNADFVVSADRAVPANSLLLAGMFPTADGSFWASMTDKWVGAVPTEEVTAGTPIRLVESTIGAYVTYEELATYIHDFDCGVKDMTEGKVLDGTTLTVMLVIYETVNNIETGNSEVVGSFTYTFGA